MFVNTACHWTAQYGQKLQHVAVKVWGLVFSVTPHSMHAMGFILTKTVKKTWRAQIGLAAGPDGRCGATWVALFGKSPMLSKALHLRLPGARPCAYNSVEFMAMFFQARILLLIMAFAVDDRATGESREGSAVSRTCIHLQNNAGGEKNDMAKNMNRTQNERRNADTLIVIDRRNGKAWLYGQLILFFGLLATVLWLLID